MSKTYFFIYNTIMKERLQKILSQAGIASRRNSELLIRQGKVKVNNKIAIIGDKASFQDSIIVNGKPIIKEEKVYYLMNKPKKVICSLKDPQGRRVITDLVDDNRHIFPVGRLDWDTTGTILLTNDGELSNRLTHPSYEVLRIYRARISRKLTNQELSFLNSDKVMLNNKISKQKITQVDNKTYVISLAVGTYHHVKRLFELVDSKVISLTRIEFAGLSHVGKLSKGSYRNLKPIEIKKLKLLVGLK